MKIITTKNLLTFLSALLFVFSNADAQPPTLTQANAVPSLGDNFFIFSIDSVSPGGSGINQVWDYSALTITSDSIEQSYVSPSSTTYGSSFPAATLAQNDGNGNTEYFATSSSSWSLVGVGSSAALTNYNGLTLFTFPFTFNTSISNNNVSGMYGGFANISGSVSTVGDAYGTLILLNDTITNVLRVKFDETLDYNFIGHGQQYYNFTTYYWYDGVHNFPLLRLSNFNTNGYQGSTYSSSAVISSIVTGVNQIRGSAISLNIYPNPAVNTLNINYALRNAGKVDIALYNMLGERIYHTSTIRTPGNNKEAIDISGFNAGIYVAEITANGYTTKRKFIIR